MIICDTNTYEVAGRLVQGLLPHSILICLDPDKLHADEKSVAIVKERLPNDTDILLAVGSGTIHDITNT
ncbi:MAG TPA: iron-containing alcohol dehydrogenase [Lachnospiraceae bacterium]|nr:iron-containing alcohol dehydrogenase [Lachnospiraceae bacterium]